MTQKQLQKGDSVFNWYRISSNPLKHEFNLHYTWNSSS